MRGARSGFRLGEGKLEDSLMVALLDTHCGLYMAQTSDNLARQHGITREAMDAYALRRQQRGRRARPSAACSREEIVPVEVAQGRKTVRVEADDHLRPDTTLEGLAALKPAFGKDGFVTAGNASGIVDGAAALVVALARRGGAARACSRWPASCPGASPACRPRSWASARCPRRARRWRRRRCRSRTWTWSRSTRRSPASTWRSRRSWASTASGPTSTAARSRSATRWARPARGCC